MTVGVSEYVALQQQLLFLEYSYEKEELAAGVDNLRHLEVAGLAVSHLSIHSITSDVGGRHLLQFSTRSLRRSSAPLRLSTGDVVVIRALRHHLPDGQNRSGHAQSAPSTNVVLAEGVLTSIDNDSLSVSCDALELNEHLVSDCRHRFALIKVTSDVTYNRYKSALNQLESVSEDPSHFANSLVRLLLGISDPPSHKVSKSTDLSSLSTPLNPQQAAAVEDALDAALLSVIHGPPGTGKTHALISYILLQARRGSRLLVVAPSNIAVDNIAERLAQAESPIEFVRVGHPVRVTPAVRRHTLEARVLASDEAALASDIRRELEDLDSKITKANDAFSRRAIRSEQRHLRKELRQREGEAVKRVLSSVQVVLTTVTGAGSRNVDILCSKMPFDVVVIDEAAQALEASVWVPILRARKAVFAGDPRQLAGTVKSPEAENQGLKRSILDRVFESERLKSCITMLTVQYRMNNVICKWSSEEFYEGRLKADASVATRNVTGLPSWRCSDDDDERLSNPFIVIDTAGGDCEEGGDDAEAQSKGSRWNEGEATIVSRVVEEFLERGVKETDIAVISPYLGQVELLRRRLWGKHSRSLEVATIDSVQGREKDVICISMVRSNESGEVGFLNDARRLNVAITRARRCVVIICDSETMSSDSFLERIIAYAETNGVYRSAVVEFTDVVGTYSQLRRPKEAIAADGKELGTARKKEVSPRTLNEPARGRRGEASSKLAEKRETRGEESNEEEDEEKLRSFLRDEIEKFVQNELIVEKQFTAELSSLGRRIVHEVAEEMNINHGSSGRGDRRQVRIWKDILMDNNDKDDELAGVSTVGPEDQEGTYDEVQVEEKEESVSSNNSLLKELREAREGRKEGVECLRADNLGGANAKRTKKGKTGRGRRRVAKKGERNDGENEGEDIDEIIAKYGWGSSNQTSAGSSSSQNAVFSSAVRDVVNGTIVNGVLTSAVDEGQKARRGRAKEAKRRLNTKLQQAADQRKRKGGSS